MEGDRGGGVCCLLEVPELVRSVRLPGVTHTHVVP